MTKRLEPQAGEHIRETLRQAVADAHETEEEVVFDFNGTEHRVYPSDTYEEAKARRPDGGRAALAERRERAGDGAAAGRWWGPTTTRGARTMATETTAVARREDTGEHMPVEIRTALERDKMIREAAAHIAAQTWGKGLSRHEHAAVARYCLEAGLDPVRHVFVLGGTVYVNAQAYMDKLAADPDFEGIRWENISGDKEAREQEGVPHHAQQAWRCHLRHRGREFVAVGYAPKGKGDPVGAAFPMEKAQTTAIRRAARLAVPMWTERVERTVEKFEYVHAAMKETQANLPPALPPEPMRLPDDPYAPDEEPVRPTGRDLSAETGELFEQEPPSAQSEGR